MASLRTEAESIANAIETGLLDVADAVAWADRQIEACDVPDAALCDVAMAASKFPQDVASMLRSIPGDLDRGLAIRETMQIALRELRRGVRDPRDIARTLFDFADDLPEGDFKHHSYCFWDAIDLARDGIGFESESDIVQRMVTMLEEFVRK